MAKFFPFVFYSLLMLTASTTVLAGELYQWVDADGVITYSPEPPPAGVTSEYREISGELTASTLQQSPEDSAPENTMPPMPDPENLVAPTRAEPIGLMKNETKIERMARLAPKPREQTSATDDSRNAEMDQSPNAPLNLNRIRLNRKCSDLNNRISALETRLSSVESAAELNQSMLLLANFQTMHENSCEREGF